MLQHTINTYSILQRLLKAVNVGLKMITSITNQLLSCGEAIKLYTTGLLGPQSIKNSQSHCRVTTLWLIITQSWQQNNQNVYKLLNLAPRNDELRQAVPNNFTFWIASLPVKVYFLLKVYIYKLGLLFNIIHNIGVWASLLP